MGKKPIQIGDSIISQKSQHASGSFVPLNGETFYRIDHVDTMRPFLISVVSASDHWMFVSSNGALTAGRRDPDNALFPYCTDDKIHDSADVTGSKTVLLVDGKDAIRLWEPFSIRHHGIYDTSRSLCKGPYGTRLRFEEINHDLNLTFWYEWGNSEQFGFVKRSGLRNNGSEALSIRILDGIQNIMPFGVGSRLQNEKSTLVDAYKKGEFYPESGLGVFSLSSMLVDKPEPAEALMATTVFSLGLPVTSYLLSSVQVEAFRQALKLATEEDVRAERASYFVEADVELGPDAERSWFIVAEVEQGPERVADLASDLSTGRVNHDLVAEDVAVGVRRIRSIAALSDALQVTNDALSDARHFSNALFNVMRGGVFELGYDIDMSDFSEFLLGQNASIYARHREALSLLSPFVDLSDLRRWIAERRDLHLTRISDEYLPLSFSRRHGDPSRPWNTFSIQTRKRDGTKNMYFEGNWRDIFQNWEALAVSFPEFVSNMIAKFVNASTVDGYNPYRITRNGIDWEKVDPDDKWSHIGYWGDHQLIYLLKHLEISNAHHPGELEGMLNEKRFAYADVPYRIASYRAILKDPHHTIGYDFEREADILRRVNEKGADGKLLSTDDGQIVLVGLGEKLLVSVLAKMSNFIPGAGIWMNTQRPEWNDANNALVGFGVSVVTLCYLRRYITFARALFARTDAGIEISPELADFLQAIHGSLSRFEHCLKTEITDSDRKTVLDALGHAGGVYRAMVYEKGLSGQRRRIPTEDLDAFFSVALDWIDHTILANRRSDGLFHSYNLIGFNGVDAISIEPLYEMLEGQVAILSSGILGIEESIEVLSALRGSGLFREDQYSYLLYPDRQLARFLDKNRLPPELVKNTAIIDTLLKDGDRRLMVRDLSGWYHFNGALKNARDVDQVLDELRGSGYEEEVERDRAAVLRLFEEVFDHRSFTGRSGTFFGYEGLGCVYWHMVSKLLLAAGETFFRATREGTNAKDLRRLADQYYDIRRGLGQNKSPEEYGAFPMDPYSHTPGNRGARQPGMTGQVKEDLLARWCELGISVEKGCIRFQPGLLREAEFISVEAKAFTYVDTEGMEKSLTLEPGSLAFTYCQVPVVYHRSEHSKTGITRDGSYREVDGGILDAPLSGELFSRSGRVQRIDVYVSPGV